MAVVFTQDSAYAKEMRRHEAAHTQYGPPGRPYVFQEFPKLMYRAERGAKGIAIADTFTVGNETEERNMRSRGFFVRQEDAIGAIEREHTEHGKLAAERNFEIAKGRLSERAAAEVRAAEEAHGATHLPMVPETPIKRRGRPKKALELA